MSGLHLAVTVGCVVLVLLVVAAGLWLSRDATLSGRVGSFRCGYRAVGGRHWAAGTVQYGTHRLYVWRRWSLLPRPRFTWPRAGMQVVARTWVDASATSARDDVVVRCRVRSGASSREVELRMSGGAYAGLTSWLEATPQQVGSVI
ncbi:DUF2550 family protein [Cellulomonas massiliensis]|uniref:DUF2550 family protein n=1 Tax=Cellulomonas massiliensis TaxID=1465811 RepID=UPI00031FE166|nr:DUF2550 family protein [Cellulomonas massiliensis]